MSAADKKFRDVRAFAWPDNGHRVNLYLNAYMNVGIRKDKFLDYIAASLETMAAELRDQAADLRGKVLQSLAVSETPAELTGEELREQSRDDRQVDWEAK